MGALKGNVVAIGAFQYHIKINFFEGASLEYPAGLFNTGLEAKTTRAINLAQDDRLNQPVFNALVRAAVARKMAGARPQIRHN